MTQSQIQIYLCTVETVICSLGKYSEKFKNDYFSNRCLHFLLMIDFVNCEWHKLKGIL